MASVWCDDANTQTIATRSLGGQEQPNIEGIVNTLQIGREAYPCVVPSSLMDII